MLCNLHEHDTIIDSGFHVCTKCGFCLDQVFSHTTFQQTQHIGRASSNEKKEKNLEETIEFLKETCSKLHIDGYDLINNIIDDYLALFRQTKDLKPTPKLLDLATLSIYKSLQKRTGISPSIIDIASVTKCNLKRVWQLQKRIEHHHQAIHATTSHNEVVQDQHTQPLSAQDIILSKIGFLDMNFADFKIMDEVIKESVEAEADFSSRSIAATVAYQYLKYHKKQRCTMKSIAHLFLTTSMSLYRYQNYLKKKGIILFK